MTNTKIALSFALILSLLAPCFADPLSEETPGKAPRFKDRPSVALVLAGGGAKGFAELPIIELIDELGIPIDMVIGTSIGSIVGGLYSAGYSPKEIIDKFNSTEWTPLFNDTTSSPYENVLGDHSIENNLLHINFNKDFKARIGSGISNGQNIYQLLRTLTLKYPSNMDFDNLPVPFRAIATDIYTGEAAVFHDGDIAEAIRASMSIPGVFEPWTIHGHHYVDGCLTDNLGIVLARNMGYDIVIAVELTPPLTQDATTYSSNPASIMMNTIQIMQQPKVKDLHQKADLVLFPDLHGLETLDFKKSKQIYEAGKECAEQSRESLEKIRMRIYPNDYDKNGKRISDLKPAVTTDTYKNKIQPVPSSLTINGAYPMDESYIYGLFEKLKRREITPEKMDAFMNSVYRLGNYTHVIPRIIENENEPARMELTLRQKDIRSFKILAGAELLQTFTNDNSTYFNIFPEIQGRGFTGVGSVLALRATLICDFGAELYYFQPINPYFFIEAKTGVLDDRYFSFTTDSKENPVPPHQSWFKSQISLGTRYSDLYTLKAGVFATMAQTDTFSLPSVYETYLYQLLSKKFNASTTVPTNTFGGYVSLNINTMDRNLFPRKGFNLLANAKLSVPVCNYSISAYPAAICSLDVKGSIPMGKWFSLSLRAFGGTDFTQNLKSSPEAILTEGFTAYDRIYFPQITKQSYYGTNKWAAGVSLQFQPTSGITILGGTPVFILAATAGDLGYNWNEMFTFSVTEAYKALWTCSAGVALVIKDRFALYLRGGVCSNKFSPVSGFFALDVGSIQF